MESKLSKGRTSLVAEELRLLSLPLQRVWAPSLVGHCVWVLEEEGTDLIALSQAVLTGYLLPREAARGRRQVH